MKFDLTKMNDIELKEFVKEATSLLQKRERELIAKKRMEVIELAEANGVDLAELAESLRGVKKVKKTVRTVPIKYRSKDDESLTWTGRGMRPRWVTAFLDAGGKLEELTV